MLVKHTHITYLIALLLFIQNSIAQESSTTAAYRYNSDRFIRLGGTDDFLWGTDNQYTEGINLEIGSPGLRKFPLSKLLLNPLPNVKVQYGIGIEQAGYTPNNLENYEVNLKDRPFAGTLFLNTFLTSIDSSNKQRFSSMLTTGVIGPAAMGKELQVGVHAMLGQVQPPGWANQISNDIILNYQVGYEKQVVAADGIFLLSAGVWSRFGTLSDKLSPGLLVMLGSFDSPFTGTRSKKNVRFYLYDRPGVDFVGYDATLQGGAFSTSPYTLQSNEISRSVLRNISGFTFTYRSVSIEYFHVAQSPQYRDGQNHSWDGIQLTTAIK